MMAIAKIKKAINENNLMKIYQGKTIKIFVPPFKHSFIDFRFILLSLMHDKWLWQHRCFHLNL